MYDVIVAGARCAGASTALLLARAGHRVLVVDRAALPADTLSTLYIHQPGVALLGRWGLLDDLRDTGAPVIAHTLYEVADVRLSARLPGSDGIDFTMAPRRHILDWQLARAAVAAGAELSDRSAVVGLLTDGDRITGVRIRRANGDVTAVRASLVVGADGMRSTVARLTRAREYWRRPRLTCAYYGFWHGVPAVFEQYQRPGRWIGAMPTHHGLTLVAAYFPQAEFRQVRLDCKRAHADAVRAAAPQLHERLAAGRPAGRLRGTGDQRNFLRTAAGPGWALVGDAGHHKDSVTARGITDAFRQAELLAGCLSSLQGGRLPPAGVDRCLRRYLAERDELVRMGYRATLAVGLLDVTPQRLALLRVIAQSADLTARYFAAAAGVCEPHELFTPELIELSRKHYLGGRPSGSGRVRWQVPQSAPYL